MDISKMEAVIEALLFTAGDVLPLEKIADAVQLDKKTTKLILNDVILNYQKAERGITIREIDGGFQLCTKPEYCEYIKRLHEPRQRQGLSQAAFETIAIIAYNQPVTKAKIEAIRGVNSDSSVTRLLDRNLIKEAGRMDAPGKPILYETTEEFLRSFGFRALDDLPVIALGDLREQDPDIANLMSEQGS